MFKDRLKELRARYNYTQSDIAEMFSVSLGAVGNWETGKRIPDTEMLARIADRFNVTVDYLIGRDIVREESTDGLDEYLEQIKTRPELKKLFSVTKDATKEEIEKAVAVIEALLK